MGKFKLSNNMLVILCMMTYMISYVTRINYGAVILEMEESTGMTKAMLSMALTGSFVTYGVGQIISGVCGDKFSPKNLVSYGLFITVLMNILIPFCQNQYQMLAAWCINGFAQAFMWPPMVKIMTEFLSDNEYKKASVKISWGASFGTIIVYLFAPILISFMNWEAVFFFSALLGAAMLFSWNVLCPKTEVKVKTPAASAEKGRITIFFTPLMLGIMLAIVLQGMLRDGVTTWMPTYISETYNLSSVISILTGVILPIFSILCLQISSLLYLKKFTNPVLCGGVIFGAGASAAAVLMFATGRSAAISAVCSAVLTGSMHGVNLMLIAMIPPFFKKYGNVSTASGILNACTYIGSAISTYGIAILSDKFGWGFTVFTWLLIAVLGTVICFACIKPWIKRFYE